MFVIFCCGLLFAVALVLITRWSAMNLQPPTLAGADEGLGRGRVPPGQASIVVPRPMWYGWLVLVEGLIAGVLGAGAGGTDHAGAGAHEPAVRGRASHRSPGGRG